MKNITLIFALLLLVVFVVQPVLSQNVDGLVAYWDFDEGSGNTAKDISGNGHDGELVGDTEWTNDGYFCGGLVFDGS